MATETKEMERGRAMTETLKKGARCLGLLSLLTLAACAKQETPDPFQEELKALDAAGFKPEAFVASDAATLKAQTCQTGTVAQLPALICQYASAEAAAAGKEAAEEWIGEAVTGVVLTRDAYLLALSDRNAIDPHGKTLFGIAQTFTHETDPAAGQ
jgi:hypothetical protein